VAYIFGMSMVDMRAVTLLEYEAMVEVIIEAHRKG
jgi:hypothetical protein